ncbi:MAG TPA: flagellar hook-length control protein FliK, partial [Holophaga sp.]|nr:flagellar hook-length control protein FliK [Holophaga sp.]
EAPKPAPGIQVQDVAPAPKPARSAPLRVSSPDGSPERDPLQAAAALEAEVPGLRLTPSKAGQGTQTTSQAPAKPALSELLSRPRPTVETPAILSQDARTESAPEAAPVQALAAPAVQGAPLPQAAAEHANPLAVQAAAPAAPSAPARAAAPAAEVYQAPVHNPVAAQMEGSIRWILKSGAPAADLQLHPESLGTVRIQIKVEGTEVHARVWATEPASLPLLQDHRASLEASLRDQGLSLGSFDLHQGRQGEQTGQAPAPAPAPEPFRAAEVGQETPTAMTPSPSNPHRIEIVA